MNRVNDNLTELLNRHKTPSVQYLFFNKDKILTSFQKGLANIARQQQVNERTTYNAFSVTKTFTALAVLQLYEKGLLDIYKPVIQYLPNFPYGSEITVKQLLNHSSGIPNPVPLSWIHLDKDHTSFDRNRYFKPLFEKHKRLRAKPNDKFGYTNLGYVLLGQLIEKISGTTYEQYVEKHIINKLDLATKDLSFTIQDDELHAKGYHKWLSLSNFLLNFFLDKSTFYEERVGRWCTFNNLYVNGAAYGGLIGTPLAFVTYIQGLLKDDSRLISGGYKDLLFKENKDNKNKNTGMCLGWFTGELQGHRYYAHTGGGGGYYCEIRIYPRLGKGSVIFFNRSGMRDERILNRLDRYLLP